MQHSSHAVEHVLGAAALSQVVPRGGAFAGVAAGNGGTILSDCLCLCLCCAVWQVVFESLLVICHRSYLFLAFDVTVDTVWFYMLLVVSSLFVTYFAVHATLFANVRPLANVLCVCGCGA